MDSSGIDLLTTPPVSVSTDAVRDIAHSTFGLEGAITSLGGERDRNFLVESATGAMVIKIANPAEPQVVLAMQQAALRHIAVSDPMLPVPRPIQTSDGADVASAEIGGVWVGVRAVTYILGDVLGSGPTTTSIRRETASLLAQLDIALQGFVDPALARPFLWNVAQLPALRATTEYLSSAMRASVEWVFDDYERQVMPILSELRSQAIHSDFNGANLIATGGRLTGVIDFGDLVAAPLVIDPAIAATYLALNEADPVAIIADFVSGYHEVNPLTDAELAVVGDLVLARLAQSLTIGAWRAEIHPDNREYILHDSAAAWVCLQHLLAVGTETINRTVRSACDRHG